MLPFYSYTSKLSSLCGVKGSLALVVLHRKWPILEHIERMYSRMNLHTLEKRKLEYSLKKLKREKSFIDFLININVKASYTYLLLYAHEKQ